MTDIGGIVQGIIALIALFALAPFLFEVLNIAYGFPVLISTDVAVEAIQGLVIVFIIVAFFGVVLDSLT